MAKDDGQVLPTEQMHERKEIHSDDNNSSVKVKVLISDVITKIGREGVCGRYTKPLQMFAQHKCPR